MEHETPLVHEAPTPDLPFQADSRNDLVLDNWKLILIFCVGLVICVIFFAAGLIVGRHQPRVVEASLPVPVPNTESAAESVSENRAPARTVAALAASGETVVDMGTQSRPVPPAPQVTESEAVSVPVTEREPSVAAPPPVVRSDASTPGFRVQVAAMKSKAEADAVVEKLGKKGFEFFVVPPMDAADVYYRVQMGDFADRASAQEMILRLQQAGERPVLKRQ